MDGNSAARALQGQRRHLQNAVKDFKPEESNFRPAEGMMTVGQQINHIAHTVEWFLEGTFGGGFDMDFTKFAKENEHDIPLAVAVARLDKAYEDAIKLVESKSEADLSAIMPPNDILGKSPKSEFVHSAADHTAHHRGILTVYLRMLGRVPTMVYS